MGAGGSPQTTTQRTSSSIPGWEQPYAKAYLSSLAGQVFPGMTLPDNYFSAKSPDFGQGAATGGVAGGAAGGSSGGNGIAAIQQALNPLAQQFLGNAVGGSSYLQGQAMNNPMSSIGASSPAALNQLQSLYGNLMGGAGAAGVVS